MTAIFGAPSDTLFCSGSAVELGGFFTFAEAVTEAQLTHCFGDVALPMANWRCAVCRSAGGDYFSLKLPPIEAYRQILFSIVGFFDWGIVGGASMRDVFVGVCRNSTLLADYGALDGRGTDFDLKVGRTFLRRSELACCVQGSIQPENAA